MTRPISPHLASHWALWCMIEPQDPYVWNVLKDRIWTGTCCHDKVDDCTPFVAKLMEHPRLAELEQKPSLDKWLSLATELAGKHPRVVHLYAWGNRSGRYTKQLRCDNCHTLEQFRIPRGIRIDDWSKDKECPKCGCIETLGVTK